MDRNSGSARHEGGGLDDDEIEGLAWLETAFDELRCHMTEAWNDAMVWVEDELVFTEMNTLMTVAREAADKVIEAMTRIARTAQEEVLETLDTRGWKSPSCVIPVALLEDSACGLYTTDNCNQIGEDKGRQLPNREE